jgi:hypothetical protein
MKKRVCLPAIAVFLIAMDSTASVALIDSGGDQPTIPVEDQDALWVEVDTLGAGVERVVVRSREEGRDEEWTEFSAPSVHVPAEGNRLIRIALDNALIWSADVPNVAQLADGRFQGTLVDASLDTLVIDFGGSRRAVPTRSVVSLQIYRGTRNHAGKGALIGMGVGILAAVIVANSSETTHTGGSSYSSIDIDPKPVGAFLGCVLLGSLIGATQTEEVWEDASLSLELVPVSAAAGVGFTATIAF